MDPTLIQATTKTAATPPARPQTPRKFACQTLVAATVLLSVGCMNGIKGVNSRQAELPIPAASLQQDQLETVRYQSPGGSGSRNQSQAGGVLRPGRSESVEIAPWEQLAPGANDEVIDQSNVITEVVVKGNQIVPTHTIVGMIQSRVGRYFDPDKLQRDMDKLWRVQEIKRINGPYINRSEDGVVITIDVVERNVIREVKFVGNRGISDRALKKEIGLEENTPLNSHEIRMAKSRLEEFYKAKGFPRTQVELMEGKDADPSSVVFLIHEDEKQRIWNVEFEGNAIASDGRLKSFIESKPGIAKLIGGVAKRDEIDQDVLRLTNYYRSLGFFNARIGRELSESNDGKWVTIRFIIDEGPRYKIRNVAFIGNDSYGTEQLLGLLELKPSSGETPEFNSTKMNKDVVSLQELYGSEGFVFASVQAEPRFLEEPGLLDLVYKIDEGKQYRVGKINVHFEGDFGITKREVVLSRMGLSPGDKIDANKIRKAKSSLARSQIFAGADSPGAKPPEIVVRPPELGGGSSNPTRVANQGGGSGTRNR